MPTTIPFNYKMNQLSYDLLLAFDSPNNIRLGIENAEKSVKIGSILTKLTPKYSPTADKPQLILNLWLCTFATYMILHLFKVKKYFFIQKKNFFFFFGYFRLVKNIDLFGQNKGHVGRSHDP